MHGEDAVTEDEEAHWRSEEGCRREEAIRSLLKQHDGKRLTISAVEEIAHELGVSRSTMYRLITAYRAKGTVSSVEPRARKDTLVLDAKREKLIASTIHEIYLKPERPTMTYLIEQVRARCAQKGLPLPDRRTIKCASIELIGAPSLKSSGTDVQFVIESCFRMKAGASYGQFDGAPDCSLDPHCG